MNNLAVKYFLVFVTLIFISQTPVFAQREDNETPTNTRIDTAAVTGGVVVDTTSKNNPEEIAKELATDLMYRINLTMEQAAKISEILVEYQDDIAEALKSKEDTGEDKEREDEALTGNEGDNELEEIDQDANGKIENELEENQLESYSFIKNEWWREVKDRIYNKDKSEESETTKSNNSIK